MYVHSFVTVSQSRTAAHNLSPLYLGVVCWSNLFSNHGHFICLDVLLFKRFKTSWHNIDKTTYGDSSTNDYRANVVVKFKDEMVEILETAFKVTQPRDHYRELLKLTIIFLGAVPFQGIYFAAPKALYHVRWMDGESDLHL